MESLGIIQYKDGTQQICVICSGPIKNEKTVFLITGPKYQMIPTSTSSKPAYMFLKEVAVDERGLSRWAVDETVISVVEYNN